MIPSIPESDAAPLSCGGEVLGLYRRQLEERQLRADPAQLAVIARLDELRRRLLGPSRTPAARLRRWLAGLASRTTRAPPKGLYLWGGVGRGKTWLMDLFFASLPPGQARRMHFHRFMHELHAQLRRLKNVRSPLARSAEIMARDTRVLCFDELYVADIADAMILGGLLMDLIERGVTLVATSNVPPSQQYRDGLQRERFLPAIRVLERHLEVTRIAGDTDYRLRQLTQAGIYLECDAPGTPARLEQLFAGLADTRARTGGVIEIEERPIQVIRAGAGAVWFGFGALCAGARSQNDYIEIAREYHSVILADVPVLDGAREDEARRFIALVDELYDHNVKLIVSAAAAPGSLYRGERLQALFARTQSRLTEMQSAEYLARQHRP